jgi:hypothetical protein
LGKRLVIFVEGKGDVSAVPALARAVVAQIGASDVLHVDNEPFRVNGLGTLVKNQCRDWHRWIGAAGKRKDVGAILLVLDGDIDRVPGTWAQYTATYNTDAFCPFRVAALLTNEARSSRAGEAFSLAVVFPMREFEAWLVASIESLRGVQLAEGRGFVPEDARFPEIDIEVKRDAKGTLATIIPGYKQSLDQGILATRVDLNLAQQRSKSFARFLRAIEKLASAVRSGAHILSPTA